MCYTLLRKNIDTQDVVIFHECFTGPLNLASDADDPYLGECYIYLSSVSHDDSDWRAKIVELLSLILSAHKRELEVCYP